MKSLYFFAIFCALLGSASADFTPKDAPKVTERKSPEGSQTAVYSYHDSIKNAINAVVSISTKKRIKSPQQNFFNDPFFQQFFGDFYRVPKSRIQQALGSGTIISADGYIVTNNHVIDGADKISVTLPGSTKEYPAKLIGADPDNDLAVIRISAQNLPFLPFANSNDALIGDVVFAIGNPFGVGETVTQGIISAINKNSVGINNYENFIQTDTSINPGNSGGALIDTRGAIVGINTAIISQSGGNVGIGFAIPANIVKDTVRELISFGRIERGQLGVSTQDVSNDLRDTYADNEGAVVLDITPQSPAQKAGIIIWDLITKVDDTPIKSSADLRNLIGSKKPGTKITLTILRDKKERHITLTLDRRGDTTRNTSAPALKTDEKSDLRGISVENISPQIRAQLRLPGDITGVVISGVRDGSPAQEAGLVIGEIISRIENTAIKNVNDFNKATRQFSGKKKRVLIFNVHTGLRTQILL